MTRRKLPRPASPGAVPCRAWIWVAGLGGLALLPLAAQAQSGRLTASVDLGTNYSAVDGRRGVDPEGQVTTQLTPRLGWSSRSGRLRGSVNYGLNLLHYSRATAARSVQHTLDGAVTAEAVSDWMFIDLRANVQQQAISAFGTQEVEGSNATGRNRTQVSTLTLAPYVRGTLAGVAAYELRLSGSATDTGRATEPDFRTGQASFTLNSATRGAVVGWGLNATRSRSQFKGGSDSDNERIGASISFVPDPELSLGLTGGQERTNLVGAPDTVYSNWGWNARWQPGPRSALTLQSERRFFGRSHSLSLSHRVRRSAWQFSDRRDISVGLSGITRPVSLFALYNELFTAQEPDAAKREQLVIDFLRAIGRDPGELIGVSFLTSAVTLQRRQDLSVAFNLQRASLSLQAFRGNTRRLAEADSGGDTLLARQSGYSAALSYRLSPDTALTLTGSRQITPSLGVQPGNDLKSLALTTSVRLGRRSALSAGARHSVFNSATDPYTESAVNATFSLRF